MNTFILTEDLIETEQEKRISGWKFWVIALILHVLLLVLLTQIGWVIQTAHIMFGEKYDDLPQGVDADVAIPGAPEGPGLEGQKTPDIKIPLDGMPGAESNGESKPEFKSISSVIGTMGRSEFITGTKEHGILGMPNGLVGINKSFGQNGTGTLASCWDKRKDPNKLKYTDKVSEDSVLKALRWLKDNQNEK